MVTRASALSAVLQVVDDLELIVLDHVFVIKTAIPKHAGKNIPTLCDHQFHDLLHFDVFKTAKVDEFNTADPSLT